MKRKAPTYPEKLAAALMQLHPDLDWSRIRAIKNTKLAAKAVLAKFQCHHENLVSISGDNHPAMLTMMLIPDHAARFAKDVKVAAKAKRLTRKQEEFRAKMLAKGFVGLAFDSTYKRKAKIPSRPLAGTKASGLRKRWNRTVERRPPAK